MSTIGQADVPAPEWDAIIVAGGRATRLGGIDKTALEWRGASLLEHAATAVEAAERVCIVGSTLTHGQVGQLPHEHWLARAGDRVLVRGENPPFSGPASAIVAGLAALGPEGSPFVVVVAADLPRVGEALARLVAGLGSLPVDSDGIVAVDGSGRAQTLLAVYRASSLRRAALSADPNNLAVRSLVGSLNISTMELSDELCADVDTAADAAAFGIAVPAGD